MQTSQALLFNTPLQHWLEWVSLEWLKCSVVPCLLCCYWGDRRCLCKSQGQPCLTVISCGASMQRGKAVRMEAKSPEFSWNEWLLRNLILPWSKGNHLQDRWYGKELLWIWIYIFQIIWNSTEQFSSVCHSVRKIGDYLEYWIGEPSAVVIYTCIKGHWVKI